MHDPGTDMVVPPQWATRPSPPLELWHASTDHPVVVVVPGRRFLAISGAGHPRTMEFALATAALRNVADTVRAGLPRDRFESARTIIEVIWSISADLTIDEILESFEHPASHRWCQLIELPAGVTDVAAAAAIDDARRQAGRAEPLVRVLSLTEGAAAQILSVGDHSEAHSIRDLYRFVVESGFRARGDLHQIVLADPDVVPRERARSVFRVPIEPV